MGHLLVHKKYDIAVRRLRTNIERFFGSLDKHWFFHYSLFSAPTISGLVSLVLNAESIRFELGHNPYSLTPDNESFLRYSRLASCRCEFPKLDLKRQENVQLCRYRAKLIESFVDDDVPVSRPSRHAKGGTLPRAAKTKKEIRDAFYAKKAARKETKQIALKKRVALRKNESRTAKAAAKSEKN